MADVQPREQAPQSQPRSQSAFPANALAAPTVAFVRERFPDAIVEVTEHRGETTIVARPAAITAICQALRAEPSLCYTFLADITAVDWLDREPRYDVVYHLLSLETRAVIRLKVRVGDEDTPDPSVPTVMRVWPTADWFEREIYDLFGIRFDGHPHLERIMMPLDWVGHPLRKDYPLTGIRLPEPHWGGQVPFAEPLPEGTGRQTLRTPDRIEEPPVTGGPREPAPGYPGE
jgi:NADH-quinone oxidoreductase subunit C